MQDDQQLGIAAPRLATPSDAATGGRLLHDFNLEFGETSPGVEVLTTRLARLLVAGNTLALLAGQQCVGFALLTLRSNVWYEGPVALLDELYIVPSMRGRGIGSRLLEAGCELVRAQGVELLEINVDGEDHAARRFYERHGFRCGRSDLGEPQLYFSREIM